MQFFDTRYYHAMSRHLLQIAAADMAKCDVTACDDTCYKMRPHVFTQECALICKKTLWKLDLQSCKKIYELWIKKLSKQKVFGSQLPGFNERQRMAGMYEYIK